MTRTKSVKALLVVLMSAALIIAFMPQTAFTSYAATAKKATSVTRSYPTTKATYTMTVGQSKTFRVRLNPKNLAKASKTTTWKLNTSKYASLAKGKYSTKYKKVNGYWYAYTTLKATKAGPVTITAKSKYGPTASWNVSVKKVLTGVTIANETTGSTASIAVGDVLKANIAPATKYAKYTWYAVDATTGAKTVLSDEAQKDNSYKVTSAAAGKKIMVEATGFTYAQGTVSATSDVTVGTAKIQAVSIVLPSDHKAPAVGDVMTAAVTPTNSVNTYQWYKAGTSGTYYAITGATSSTYTVPASDIGYTYKVYATDSFGTVKDSDATGEVVVSVANGSIAVAKTNNTTVATLVKGDVVKATVKDAAGNDISANCSYQWYLDSYSTAKGAKNVKANGTTTAQTYTVVAADAGHTLVCVATANTTGYTDEIVAAATTSVTDTISSVTLAGTMSVGNELTATPVTTGGAATKDITATYVWTADGVAISGATKSTFTPSAAQMGKQIGVTVTGTGAFSGVKSYTSNTNVAAGTFSKVEIQIDKATVATAPIGSTLTAKATGAAESDVTYQWYRNGIAISGATGTTYTTVAADEGLNITVIGTVSQAAYGATNTKTSDPCAVKKALSSVKLAGTEDTTGTLTATVTPTVAVTPVIANPGDYTVAWYVDNTLAAHQIYKDVSGTPTMVTSDTLTLGGTYEDSAGGSLTIAGHKIICVVTGADKYAGTVSAKSGTIKGKIAATETSIKYNSADCVTPVVGQKLSVTTLDPANTTGQNDKYTVQWYRSGVAISGATKDDYTVTAADLDKKITAIATGTGDYTGTVEFTTTNVVVASALSVAIDKTSAAVGDVLTVAAKDSSGNSVSGSCTYQWYKADATAPTATVPTTAADSYTGFTAISGQTASTYTVTDAGTTVFCVVTPTDKAYGTTSMIVGLNGTVIVAL